MSKNFKNGLICVILLISFLLPFLIFGSITTFSMENEKELPIIQAFSKDDYIPVLDEKSQGLGNITISKIKFNEEGFYNNSDLHPDLDDDLTSGALDMNYEGTEYLSTVSFAQYDNFDNDEVDNEIVILLNESLSIEYDVSIPGSESYLIYGLRLSPVTIKKVYVQNQSTEPIVELTENEFSIDSANFINFDYYNFFSRENNNFSFYITYEYKIDIQDWYLLQDPDQDLIMTEQEHTFTTHFIYNFTLSGNKYNRSLNTIVPAFNFQVNVNLSLPDKKLLFDHSMWINDIELSNFLKGDDSINFTSFADYSNVQIEFNTNFTIRFEEPIDFSWAIDRLVGYNDIRERVYFPTLLSGPEHIYIEKISIFEKTITIDQVLSNYSLFDRSFVYSDANVSIIQEVLEKSLVFTKNSVKKKGLRIIIPFLIKGETNPCIIRYKTGNNLRLIITDNIYMPLVGIKVELTYFNKPYGTYISNDLVQPMAPAFSNEHGEVIIYNVPNGIYDLKIYQNNRLLLETEVSSSLEVNYIVTDIIHFPIVILIFIAVYSIISLMGFALYLKYKKIRF